MNDIIIIAALSYPCRGDTDIKIALCNGNTFKWEFSKFDEDSSDSSCITKKTNTACDVSNNKVYNGTCSGAASDTCPSTCTLAPGSHKCLRSSQK
jgi:hypothetical protein